MGSDVSSSAPIHAFLGPEVEYVEGVVFVSEGSKPGVSKGGQDDISERGVTMMYSSPRSLSVPNLGG